MRGSDERAPGALLQRAGGEVPAVHVLAAQPDEEVARTGLAGIEQRPPRAGLAGIAGGEPRAGGLGQPGGGTIDHARAPRHSRRASRATVTSSNGSLRPSSNSCPCSWPLPAITTTSLGAAVSIASPIARRRSTSR